MTRARQSHFQIAPDHRGGSAHRGGAAVALVPRLYHRILVLNPTFAKPFADASVPFVMSCGLLALGIVAIVGLIAAGIALSPTRRGKIALTVAICCIYVGSAACDLPRRYDD